MEEANFDLNGFHTLYSVLSPDSLFYSHDEKNRKDTYINRDSLLVVDTLTWGQVLGQKCVVFSSKDEDTLKSFVRLD